MEVFKRIAQPKLIIKGRTFIIYSSICSNNYECLNIICWVSLTSCQWWCKLWFFFWVNFILYLYVLNILSNICSNKLSTKSYHCTRQLAFHQTFIKIQDFFFIRILHILGPRNPPKTIVVAATQQKKSKLYTMLF